MKTKHQYIGHAFSNSLNLVCNFLLCKTLYVSNVSWFFIFIQSYLCELKFACSPKMVESGPSFLMHEVYSYWFGKCAQKKGPLLQILQQVWLGARMHLKYPTISWGTTVMWIILFSLILMCLFSHIGIAHGGLTIFFLDHVKIAYDFAINKNLYDDVMFCDL